MFFVNTKRKLIFNTICYHDPLFVRYIALTMVLVIIRIDANWIFFFSKWDEFEERSIWYIIFYLLMILRLGKTWKQFFGRTKSLYIFFSILFWFLFYCSNFRLYSAYLLSVFVQCLRFLWFGKNCCVIFFSSVPRRWFSSFNLFLFTHIHTHSQLINCRTFLNANVCISNTIRLVSCQFDHVICKQ